MAIPWKLRLSRYGKRWVRAWIELVESLITILCLGTYSPSWSFMFLLWTLKRDVKRRMANEAKVLP